METVTEIRSGLADTNATPAGRSALTGTAVVPGARSVTSSVDDERGALEAIEVGHGTADREDDPVRRQGVGPVRARAEERGPDLVAPGPGHLLQLDRHTDRLDVEGDDARRQGEGRLERLVGRHPADRHRGGVDALEWLEVVDVALDRDDLGFGRRGDELETGSRVAGHERTDREGPRLLVREDRDRDPGRGGLHVDLADGVAVRVDRHETHVLVDVDPGLDEHIGLGRDDARPGRTRARRSRPPSG